MTAPVLRTAEVVDELVGDDGAVVLVGDEAHGHRVLRIGLLGQVIREEAAHGIALPALVEALVARLGAPGPDLGDAAAMTEAAVAALAAEGLLETD